MNLGKKKILAARTLGVGKDRIVFNIKRLSDIKEAITKQDIRDLLNAHAIFVKEPKGRKTKVKKRSRRRAGSIRKKIKGGKREYIILTRKLRAHLAELKRKGEITPEKLLKMRREIKSHAFKSKAHMKEVISHKAK
ncbi:MAG: 50S ribosomal protein L19e [Nanoarchaeota archaeon]